MHSIFSAVVLTLVGFNFAFASTSTDAGSILSEVICADNNTTVCADIIFLTPISSAAEGQFIVRFKAPATTISNLDVDLWMNMGGHGHGSSPVDVSALSEAYHYKVTNAWFVMPGSWLIRLKFSIDSKTYQLAFPVMVAE